MNCSIKNKVIVSGLLFSMTKQKKYQNHFWIHSRYLCERTSIIFADIETKENNLVIFFNGRYTSGNSFLFKRKLISCMNIKARSESIYFR